LNRKLHGLDPSRVQNVLSGTVNEDGTVVLTQKLHGLSGSHKALIFILRDEDDVVIDDVIDPFAYKTNTKEGKDEEKEKGGEIQAEGRHKGYTIIREIGRGGFGVTYLAQDQQNGTLVCVKELIRISSEDGLAPLKKECEMLLNLDHGGIVKCLDFNLDRGVPFFVMNYIKGKTLNHYMWKQPGVPLYRYLLPSLFYLAINCTYHSPPKIAIRGCDLHHAQLF